MAPQDSLSTQVSATRESEIGRLFNELSTATMDLQDTTESVISRLDPVLRNEPSASPDEPKLAATTNLGTSLVMVIERVKATTQKLREANYRLEV